MVLNLGDVAAGSTLYVPFATYNAAGASVTITGLAVTDIEIYKNGSVTQRASDAGYTLLDTDGIDFDGITGIHGFSVDLSDNTDSGFYAAGSAYWLVVSAITVDSQTVNFVYYFTIDKANVLRPTTAGRTLDVAATGEAGIDMDNILLTNGAPKAGIHASGTLSGTHSTTTADLGTNAPGAGLIVVGMTLYFPAHGLSVLVTAYNDSTGVATFEAITPTLANGNVWFLFPTAVGTGGSGLDAAGVRAALGMASADLDTQLDAIKSDTAATLVDTAEIGTAGAGLTNINLPNQTMDIVGNITGNLSGSVGSVTGLTAANVGAILALLDDARTEPGQGAPPVNPDLATKIDYLYKAWRNRKTQTATEFALYADDGTTKDQESSVSSDGTTLIVGEMSTGA